MASTGEGPSIAGIGEHRPSFGSAPRAPRECGALPFLIRRDGAWLYRGSPIRRKELVCLFASVLRRDAEGTYWLETPAERGTIEVEDAPFVAVELDWQGSGESQALSVRTNTDEVVTLGLDHPVRVARDRSCCTPIPYVQLRPGAGRFAVEARVSRAVYYEMVALAVPGVADGRCRLGVWSCRRFFPLGDLPAEQE